MNNPDPLLLITEYRLRFVGSTAEQNVLNACEEAIRSLRAERDEARRIAAYQYAKHHNGDEDTLVRNFFEFRGWDCSKDKK